MTEATTRAATREIRAAAERLLTARTTGVPCAPIRDLIGSDDITAAYDVQARVAARRLAAGVAITGRKVGLTSKAVQQQLGVDQPDFGMLFSDMAYLGGDTVPGDAVMQPRAEAEIAFLLHADLADGPLDAKQVRNAIGYAVTAIEICGSRIEGWDISIGDTVADNASAGAYVLGPHRKSLAEFEPRDASMTMTVNGVEVSSGSGDACCGDPLNAVVWLAQKAREFGEPLRAGQVILSGALGPMHAIVAGDKVRAVVDGLGSVVFTLGPSADADTRELS